MPGADLALLLDAAREAAGIAMGHFGRAPEIWEKPDGHGPVTEADLAVDRMLRAELTSARPDYGWLSEESPDTQDRLGAERVFIVDPIDGTRAFIAGKKPWAHSLAIAERGRVIAGVVLLPALERTYAAAEGAGATLDGAAIAPTAREGLDGASVLATGGQFSEAHWPGGAPVVERHFRPSLAYRMCLAAEGRFDAMITFRDAWEWDVAAGDLIAREAGAAVTTREGARAVYNNRGAQVAGMVVAGPALHSEIIARRRGAG